MSIICILKSWWALTAFLDFVKLKYTKISKKAGNQSCPESSTSSNPYDNTYVDFDGFTQGSKGTYTYTTTCELK